MDISTLQTFIEVMRLGSFAAVAKQHNIDPSSVSRSIAGLEKELGVRLLQRTTRKLVPTEAGLIYLQRIEPLIEEIQQAASVVAEVAGQPKGILRVTASVSFGLICIVPLLPKFRTAYPDLEIDLLLTDSVVDIFTERIDIAIRLGTLPDSTLIARQLIPTRYFVCASPDYLKNKETIIRPQDIMQHDCLLFPLAGFRSRWIFKDKQNALDKVPVSGSITISSAIALKQCAIAGLGLALLADWAISEELKTGRLINVLSDYRVTATDFNTSAWLVYPSRAYLPLKVRVFSDFLRKNIVET